MRRCTVCNKEDGSYFVQVLFEKYCGLSGSRKKYVCSKKCLKKLPKKYGIKFKVIKLCKEVKK